MCRNAADRTSRFQIANERLDGSLAEELGVRTAAFSQELRDDIAIDPGDTDSGAIQPSTQVRTDWRRRSVPLQSPCLPYTYGSRSRRSSRAV